jgi:hypothetical protein
VAGKLRVLIFHLFGVEWVIPRRAMKLLASWRGQWGSRFTLEAWKMTPLCLMWYIWRERNAKKFEYCERLVLDLKVVMFKFLYAWMMGTILLAFLVSQNFWTYVLIFLPNLGFLLYTSCVHGYGLCLSMPFEIDLLIKKIMSTLIIL